MAEAPLPAAGLVRFPFDKMVDEPIACRDPRDLRAKLEALTKNARNANVTKEECLQLLQIECPHFGYKCNCQTPQNESCFFHAISDQLDQLGVTAPNAYNLRLDLVSDMQRNPVKMGLGQEIDLRKYVFGNWSTYLSQMEKPETFADEVAIIAMAHYLNKDITIITSFPWSTTYDIFIICGPPSECTKQMLMVGHVCETYYQSLQKASEGSQGSSKGTIQTYTSKSGTGSQGSARGLIPDLPVDIRSHTSGSGTVSTNYSSAHDSHSLLANHPAVLSGMIKREEIPKDVVTGGKYLGWQVELYHDRADTLGFDPDRSFEEPDIPFQFQDDLDARLQNINRHISMIKEHISNKRMQMSMLPSLQSTDPEADKEVLLEDIRELETYIAGLEQEHAQIRVEGENSTALAQQRKAEIDHVMAQAMLKLFNLQTHTTQTINTPWGLSEEVRSPRYHNKLEWLTGSQRGAMGTYPNLPVDVWQGTSKSGSEKDEEPKKQLTYLQKKAKIEEEIKEETLKLLPQILIIDRNSLRETLQEHATETRNDPRSPSEQVQLPRYHSKFEWITCGFVDFVSQFEMIRDIIGESCSVQICPKFQRITELLNATASFLDDERTILPIIATHGYPHNFLKEVTVMFKNLCGVFVHFYKQHLPKIGSSELDVIHIGLHFYAFAKTFQLVDDQRLHELVALFI